MNDLFWQPAPVTKCEQCVLKEPVSFSFRCSLAVLGSGRDTYKQNKDGITESCPMWIKQNKDKNEFNNR